MDPDEWDDIATATEHTAGGKQFNAELDRAKNDQNRAYQEVNRVTSSVTSLFGTGVGARLNEVLAEERRSANFVEVLMRNRIEELAQEVLRLEEELKQKGKS